ncbi:hypothetical protein HAX54_006106, partial [Datura stramonium]|nr:hypothetical protein [Datura stramonium]
NEQPQHDRGERDEKKEEIIARVEPLDIQDKEINVDQIKENIEDLPIQQKK